jgi:ribosomal protein L32
LTYKRVDLGPVGPSDHPSLQVTYTKTDQALTVDSIQATPVPPAEPSLASAPQPQQVVAWVVIGLAAVVIAAVAVLYLRVWRAPAKQRTASRKHRRRSGSQRPAPSLGVDRESGERIFCHVCGQEAGAGDRYCRACGSRLRTGPGASQDS